MSAKPNGILRLFRHTSSIREMVEARLLSLVGIFSLECHLTAAADIKRRFPSACNAYNKRGNFFGDTFLSGASFHLFRGCHAEVKVRRKMTPMERQMAILHVRAEVRERPSMNSKKPTFEVMLIF